MPSNFICTDSSAVISSDKNLADVSLVTGTGAGAGAEAGVCGLEGVAGVVFCLIKPGTFELLTVPGSFCLPLTGLSIAKACVLSAITAKADSEISERFMRMLDDL